MALECLLVDYFERAKRKLDEHGRENVCGCACTSALTLEEQRLKVLQLQNQAVKESVAQQQQQRSKIVSEEELKEALSGLGGREDMHGWKVKEAMERMNAAARSAFARAVISAQLSCASSTDLTDATLSARKVEEMQRSEVQDYMGLCTVAITQLPPVTRFVLHGSRIDFTSTVNTATVDTARGPTSTADCQQRLSKFQLLMLRAVLAVHNTNQENHHDHATLQALDKKIMQYLSPTQDHENTQDTFATTFRAYASAIKHMATKANIIPTFDNLSISENPATLPSDQDEGGVTRVLSVTYSQDANSTHAPLQKPLVMEQRHHQDQKHTLHMAQQTASLQQQIIQELETMSQEQRQTTLNAAATAHHKFMEEAMRLEPGPERVLFLRNVDENTQRLMLMHQLWQQKQHS